MASGPRDEQPEPSFEERLSERLRIQMAGFLEQDILPKVSEVMDARVGKLTEAIQAVQDSIPTIEQVRQAAGEVAAAQISAVQAQATEQLRAASAALEGAEEKPADEQANGATAAGGVAGALGLKNLLGNSTLPELMQLYFTFQGGQLDLMMKKVEAERGLIDPFLMLKVLREKAPDLMQWNADTYYGDPMEERMPEMLARTNTSTWQMAYKAGLSAAGKGGAPVPEAPFAPDSRSSDAPPSATAAPPPSADAPSEPQPAASTVDSSRGSGRGSAGEPGFLALKR